MGVDFNRISFGISSGTSRTGFGTIVSFPSGPAAIPEEGTILSTLYATTYPTAQGGSSVYIPELINSYENQNCDVNIVADGSGGSYTDWVNVTNIVFKTNFIENYPFSGSNSISTPVGNFTIASWESQDFYHDGMGGYSATPLGVVNASVGDYIGNDPSNGNGELEVPSGNNTFFAYGSFSGTNYYYDGMGGYYTSPIWVTFVSDGDFIWNDGTYDYYWTVISTSNVSYRT